MKTNKIICGDNIQVLSTFRDECIDLTVTSPPYDNLRYYEGYNFDFENLAKELFRITKQGGVVVWVVGDATIKGSETGTSFKQALFFKEIGFRLHDTMIYEKNSAPYPASKKGNRYTQIFEYMFVFSKNGRPKTANIICDKKNKRGGKIVVGVASYRKKDGVLIKRGKQLVDDFGVRNNIWRYNTGKGTTTKDEIAHQHPAIFPDALAQDHIISWSNEGDIVLDPMCGSGTTCLMAKKLNRKYIGIDVSKYYCRLSEKRLTYNEDIIDLAKNLKSSDFDNLLL